MNKLHEFFHSMRWMIIVTYFMVMLITLILLTSYVLNMLSVGMREEIKNEMISKGEVISFTVSAYMNMNNLDASIGHITDVLSGTQMSCIVMDEYENVMLALDDQGVIVNDDVEQRYIATYFDEEQDSVVYKEENEKNSIMAVAVPFAASGREYGKVYLKKSIYGVDELVESVGKRILVFSLLIMLIIGIIGWRISVIIISPLHELVKASKEISKGNYSVKLNVNGPIEIEEMAESMNYMCSELECAEEKRHKFISDASHEMKTPLSIIKLIADSIVNTENPNADFVKDFLTGLNEEVDRLTRIVNRLLLLAKLETKEDKLNIQNVDISALVRKVIRRIKPFAIDKDIRIIADFDDEDNFAEVDSDKITEVVYNVIENAVKYTENGGYVNVDITRNTEDIIIAVEDNGPGIPEKEHNNVFKRFYRPDVSRTRETGGTGLGLAIAREAVMMHGGKIDFESNEGKGTRFTIVLPIKSVITTYN